MLNSKQITAAFLGMALLSTSIAVPAATAKPHNKKKGAPDIIYVPVQTQVVSPVMRPTQLLTFSSIQRTSLVSLLRGTSPRNSLLSGATRTLILNQASALPPGIQKQLLRGKGLPPGIAKKVLLPKQVNSYLNLPSRYDLIVLGSNVLLYDTSTSAILDIITRIF